MDTTQLLEGTISLYRCASCTFQVVRRPGEYIGHYRLTRERLCISSFAKA
jgi:hypothetical protein